MDERLSRVLILDTDPDTLITLQRVLEQAEVDTTITWDEAEARQLLETRLFDLLLIGDHPPELDAAAILHDLSFQGAATKTLILGGTLHEKGIEYFCGIGAIAVVPKRDPLVVVEQVTRALASAQFETARTRAGLGLAEARRVAS